MTETLLAENAVLTEQRDLMIGEYLSKVEVCDECRAQHYCIMNDLRRSREPQDYCEENFKQYLKSLTYPLKTHHPEVKIYVAMHKRDKYIQQALVNPIFVPIHCGKAIYTEEEDTSGWLSSLSDDTGDNISDMNPHYCELTAAYWIWKNDTSRPDDIVGLNHYRRYFADPDMSKNELIQKETVVELLKQSDFLVNGCGTEWDGTTSDETSVYNSYSHIHEGKDMDNALIAVKELFPDLYPRFEHEIMHSGAMCLCNMFVTTKKKFDEYCSFLFPVLEQVGSKIDWTDSRRQGYGGRALGFLSERLLRAWLKSVGYSGRAVPCIDWEKYSGYKWK